MDQRVGQRMWPKDLMNLENIVYMFIILYKCSKEANKVSINQNLQKYSQRFKIWQNRELKKKSQKTLRG